MEVNLALIACCGPALKALSHRWFPGLLGSQSGGTGDRRNNVYYTPNGYHRSNDSATHGKSGSGRHREYLGSTSRGARPEDAQYGLRNLDERGRETDGDGDSQEAIVVAERVRTKREEELDFGFDDTPTEPRRAYWRTSEG